MATSLDYLKQTGTVVVSDSGEFEGTYKIHALKKILIDEQYSKLSMCISRR